MSGSSFTIRLRGSNGGSTIDDTFEDFSIFMTRRIQSADRIQQLSSNPFTNKNQKYSVSVTGFSTATSSNIYLAVSSDLIGSNALPNKTAVKQAGDIYDCAALNSLVITAGTDTKTSTTNVAGTCTYNGKNYTVIRVNGSTPRNIGTTFEFMLCFP
jgi:hypothetical protein